jgi:hypothetical protein
MACVKIRIPDIFCGRKICQELGFDKKRGAVPLISGKVPTYEGESYEDKSQQEGPVSEIVYAQCHITYSTEHIKPYT